MFRVILFGFALISLLSVVCGRYVNVYDTDEEWTVMGVYDTPLQYAAPTKGEVQYQQVEYAAPLKSTPIQYQYTAPAVKSAPLQYATVQIPETRYQTTYQNVPQTSYNIVPIVTLQKSKGDVGFGGGNGDDDDDDEMLGNGGGRYGRRYGGMGGMGGMVAGPLVNPAMGGFGYGAKGGFGSFGGGYGAGNYPLGTYFGFPTIAFLGGIGGGGGHGGH